MGYYRSTPDKPTAGQNDYRLDHIVKSKLSLPFPRQFAYETCLLSNIKTYQKTDMSTKNIIFFNPRGNLEEYIRLLNLDNLKPESQEA